MAHRCTERQLEVMDIIWRRDGATAREIHEELDPERESPYTTYLTLLRTLQKRGVVRAERNPEDRRQYIYLPKRSRREEARRWVDAMNEAGILEDALEVAEPMAALR